MSISELPAIVVTTLEVLSTLFIFVLGTAALVLVGMYIRDVTQKTHAIHRNYPVVGRFRYLFEKLIIGYLAIGTE